MPEVKKSNTEIFGDLLRHYTLERERLLNDDQLQGLVGSERPVPQPV